jgi:hypothetical protein
MAVAQRQSALTFELRTSTALARFLHARGRSAEAAQQLTGVYSRLTEGFSSADVRDAEAMIQTLGVARASPVT